MITIAIDWNRVIVFSFLATISFVAGITAFILARHPSDYLEIYEECGSDGSDEEEE
jgi:hypothetical protein